MYCTIFNWPGRLTELNAGSRICVVSSNAFTHEHFGFYHLARRRMHVAMGAYALAIFWGGLGTLDDLFEILPLKQTRNCPVMVAILFCGTPNWERMATADHV